MKPIRLCGDIALSMLQLVLIACAFLYALITVIPELVRCRKAGGVR